MKPRLSVFTVIALASACLAPLAGQVLATFTVTSPAFDDGDPVPKRNHSGFTGAKNESPQLVWVGSPSSTKEFAVILENTNAISFDRRTPFVQWVVYGIPGTATGLPAGLKPGAVKSGPLMGTIQGVGDLDRPGTPGKESQSFSTAEYPRPGTRNDGAFWLGGTPSTAKSPSPTSAWSPPTTNPRYYGPLPHIDGVVHHFTCTVYAIDAALNLAAGLDAELLRAAIKGHVVGVAKLTGITRR